LAPELKNAETREIPIILKQISTNKIISSKKNCCLLHQIIENAAE
jgi:hypothetical protein